MAAALAYYTVFSLPPILVLVILVASTFFGESAVEGRVAEEIDALVGPQAANQIQTMISNARAQLDQGGSRLTAIVGTGALIFGATGAFAQLQRALNRAWGVQYAPERGGIWAFLLKRVISFGMIIGVGFLLLVSLVLSAVVSWLGNQLEEILPIIPLDVQAALDFMLSVSVITVLFAAIFKVLPDAKIAWRDVWVGAGFTAALFVFGKVAMGLYLGRSDPGSVFGAAGSLALVLLWIYFSSIVVLMGAEFTQVWARTRGKQIVPASGAVRVIRQTRRPSDEASAA